MVSSISIEYERFSNISVLSIDETLTGTTTSSQRGHESNGNEYLELDRYH